MLLFGIIFLDFIKQKTRPPPPQKKEVRHNSLDQDVGYMCRKCQESIYRSKRDIDVQEKKLKMHFFCMLYYITGLSL